MAFAKQKLSPKITAAPLLLAKKVSFFPPPSYTKTYYIHTSFYVPLSFSQLFFLLPQLCEGGRAFYFWSSVLLHTTYISIYSHITTTRTTEKVCCFCCCWLCFAAISVLSQILIKRLSQLSTQLFSLGFKGKKPIKEKAILGKHCWDLTWRNLELFISFEILSPFVFFFFYFLSHVPLFYQNE